MRTIFIKCEENRLIYGKSDEEIRGIEVGKLNESEKRAKESRSERAKR